MQYFTEDNHDIEGYLKNLTGLEKILDPSTYQFMLNHSFHDSQINKLIVVNHEATNALQQSPVSIWMQLTDWSETDYELIWEDVRVFQTDFDIRRNKVAGTKEILFERGLDQWSYDELTQIEMGILRHEIRLFSQTRISIECRQFRVKKCFKTKIGGKE